jgi:hypothetical protein
MWLAQFVCAPQFFKTLSGLCGHTVHTHYMFRSNWPASSVHIGFALKATVIAVGFLDLYFAAVAVSL